MQFLFLTIWIAVVAAAVCIAIEKYLARQAHRILGENETPESSSHRS